MQQEEPKSSCPKCRTTDFDNCHSIQCPMREEEPKHNCRYSKAMNQSNPRLCVDCGKEESKQDYSGVHLRHCYQGEYEDGCKYGENDCPAKPLEPKQETLEEAAEKGYRFEADPMMPDKREHQDFLRIFKKGAKWQSERMYSEEIDLFINEIKTEFKDDNWDYLEFIKERVVEQFKNK
jgi:hypothetical protein